MQFRDALTLDAPRRTKDGYLAVRAKAARTGVYQYLGSEVDPDNTHGLRDKGLINVLRDESTVFDTAAAQSFVGKPVTDDHPKDAVTADNWRDHARGTIMGVMREGDYLAFDLLLTDAATIAKVDGGKRELSNGYAAELEFGDFKAADGTICQARQSKITGGNHVALVDRGRAGSECAIKDGFAVCDANPAILAALTTGDTPMKIRIGDAEVDATNGEAVRIAVDALNTKLSDSAKALTDAQAKVAEQATTLAAKDAEIATLNQKVADSALTPAKLRDAAKAYAQVCDKAKALGVTFAEDADADAIMKAVVDAKMGDQAKGWTADQIAASFAVLSKDAKAADPVRDAFRGGIVNVGDAAAQADAALSKSVDDLNAWRNQ
ncbi:hypothetical protein GGR43_004537 [Sphingobium jiangsuense]|uniref:DUF2213 domain-containing protein n=2 Tax=Sphingobium jiangsuense TaxID=870476 RepID=A0A7W6BS49_9SPHN|nr:DUF2213 domain-containing protein [Sphingobium jiangsuense]MBB3928792.1 hypothetical protein [Sphingobium jiangsuense]